MSNFISDFFTSGFHLTLFSLLIYICGNFLFNLAGKDGSNEYKAFFWKVAIGLISVIVTFALIKTTLLTMYLGVILSLAFYLFNYKIKLSGFTKSFKIRIETKALVVYLGILLLSLLGVHYLFYFDNRLLLHDDMAFYAKVGYALFENGIETMNAESIQTGPVNASIYHYFNEWCIAFFLGFSKLTSLKVFILLVLPVQLAVIGSGAFFISGTFLKNSSKFQLFILSLFIIFFPGIISYFLNILLSGSLKTQYSILQSGILNLKTKIITILIMLFIIDFRKNIKENNYLPISLIPLFWNSLIPAFLGGYILYFIYKLYNKLKINRTLLLQFLIPIIYIPIHLLIINVTKFFDHSQISNQKDYKLTNFLIETYSNPAKLLQTILVWIIPLSVITLILILKFDLIFQKIKNRFSLKSDDLKTLLILSLFITISAMVTHGILRDIYNARQVLTNIFYPVFNLCIFLIILLFFQKMPRLFYPAVLILLAVIGFNLIKDSSFTNKRVNELSKKIKDLEPANEKILFASDIKSKEEAFALYQKPYAFLLMNNENYNPIKLNIMWPTEKINAKEKWDYYYAVSNQTFYKYVNKSNLNNDVDKAKENFMKENKIQFLLIDSTTMNTNAAYLERLDIENKIVFDKNIYLLKLNYR